MKVFPGNQTKIHSNIHWEHSQAHEFKNDFLPWRIRAIEALLCLYMNVLMSPIGVILLMFVATTYRAETNKIPRSKVLAEEFNWCIEALKD